MALVNNRIVVGCLSMSSESLYSYTLVKKPVILHCRQFQCTKTPSKTGITKPIYLHVYYTSMNHTYMFTSKS